MTWREFQLRRFGFIRSTIEEWKKTRLVSYYSLVATGAINTKKMSIEKFMPLDENSKPKERASAEAMNYLFESQKIVLEKIKQKENGIRT